MAGRPTIYCDEMVAKAADYLDTYTDDGDVIPSIEGLALRLCIARSTVYKWAEEEGKEPFSDILDQLMAKQGKELINKGLTGDFNSTISKLILTKHRYSDKQEHSGPDGKPIEMDSVNTFHFVPVDSNG